jgi:hypothetical protein
MLWLGTPMYIVVDFWVELLAEVPFMNPGIQVMDLQEYLEVRIDSLAMYIQYVMIYMYII